jgi:hypothetical protein
MGSIDMAHLLVGAKEPRFRHHPGSGWWTRSPMKVIDPFLGELEAFLPPLGKVTQGSPFPFGGRPKQPGNTRYLDYKIQLDYF